MMSGNTKSKSQSSLSASEEEKEPIPRSFNPRKRDSGYGTDFSPFSSSTPRQFTFSPAVEGVVFDLSHDLEAVDLNDEVFAFEVEESKKGSYNDDADDADKEVEEILNESAELETSKAVSQPIEINRRRPTAPLPTPADLNHLSLGQDNAGVNSGLTDFSTFETIDVKHTVSKDNNDVKPKLQIVRHMPPPAGQRSTGTQTHPNTCTHTCTESEKIHCQGRGRSLHRGNTLPLLRLSVETDRNCESDPLPDIVPCQRNRSVSLPEVQPLSYHSEQNIGRTLRRISDEFESFHRQRRRRSLIDQAASFPLSFDLVGCWNSLSRYLSADSTESKNDPVEQSSKSNSEG